MMSEHIYMYSIKTYIPANFRISLITNNYALNQIFDKVKYFVLLSHVFDLNY